MRVLMTPSWAEQLLEKNTYNRAVKDSAVKTLARKMTDKDFPYTGEPIIVSKNGVLLDGQHRLLAVVMSGESVEMEFVDGVDERASVYIDTGIKRSTGDFLAMRGHAKAVNLGASARAAICYLQFNNLRVTIPSSDIVAFIEANPRLVKLYERTMPVASILPPAGVTAVAFLATLNSDNEAKMEAFLEGVITGANLSEGDARLSLRNAVTNARHRSVSRTNPSLNWVFVASARAWNAFERNRPIGQIRYTTQRGTATKVILPEIAGSPRPGSQPDLISALLKAA